MMPPLTDPARLPMPRTASDTPTRRVPPPLPRRVTGQGDDPLADLLPGQWVLTLAQSADGTEQYVAHRPVGWTGPDPHTRIVAADREEMARRLRARTQETP